MFVKTTMCSPSHGSEESGYHSRRHSLLTCQLETLFELGDNCQNYASELVTGMPDLEQPFHDFAVSAQGVQYNAETDSNFKLYVELNAPPVSMASESSTGPLDLITRAQQEEQGDLESMPYLLHTYPLIPDYRVANTYNSTAESVAFNENQPAEDSNSCFPGTTRSTWYSGPTMPAAQIYYVDQMPSSPFPSQSTSLEHYESDPLTLWPYDNKQCVPGLQPLNVTALDQLDCTNSITSRAPKKESTNFLRKPSSILLVSNTSPETISTASESASSIYLPTPSSRKGTKRKRGVSGEKCAVCSDLSSGSHYGIQVCEGCKNFFKRSLTRLQKGMQAPYMCLQVHACTITPQTRNQCKACRLHKCLALGMTSDRLGTYEKTQAFARKFLSKPLDLLNQLITAHSASFIPVPSVMLSRHANLNKCQSSTQFPPECDLSYQGAKNVQHYAERLPVFMGLPRSIQEILLKHNMVDIMVLRTASRYCPERSSYVFPIDREMTETMFKQYPLGLRINDRVRNLGRLMFNMDIEDTEISFLSVLLLITPHTPDLEHLEHVVVAEVYKKLLRAFKRHIKARWLVKSNLHYKLLCLLPEIKATALCIPKT